jgi:hypothetical protein
VSKSSNTTQPSSWQNGGFIGAVLGGLARGLLAFFNLHGQDGWGMLILPLCFPSILLGALCGGLAGASRTPLRGAVWGGILSAVSFTVFVIPIAWVFTLFGGAGMVEEFTLPYLLQRVLLGAAVGGFAARIGHHRHHSRVDNAA